MNNIERYNAIFKKTFNVDESSLNSNLAAGLHEKWDSITHLSLITSLEDEFDIMMDSEDILELRSYEIGKQVLLKYGIEL
jgi:acyl carrier protein